MIGAILGAAAGLAGSVIGGIQSRNSAKKAQAQLDAREKRNNDWYNQRYNEDYTQTAESQRMITQAKEEAMRQINAARGAQAVMGGTEEAVQTAQNSANNMISNAVSSIAAQGTARKDAIEGQYRSLADQIAQQRIAVYNQRAANSTAAANGAMQAGMGLVNMDMSSKMDTGRGLFEDWFKKKNGGN